MSDITQYNKKVGAIIHDLDRAGYSSVLIGGLALMILGSRRVTKDFDFVISESLREEKKLVEIFYNHGFELVSKIDKKADVITTIDNKNIANIRLKLDEPKSSYFYNHELKLKIDLLFDFPFQVEELLERSSKKTISSYKFNIASKEDLIKLKEIAVKNRNLSTDIQDLEFLKSLD